MTGERRFSRTALARAALAGVICLGALAFSPRAAHACSCVSGGPACQAFWNADAVFDATVVKVVSELRSTDPDNRFPLSRLAVTLEVRQSWKGVDTSTVEVVTNAGGGSCGFNFEVGHRYLVFASRGGADPRPNVSTCSRTREYAGSSEDIAFLSSLGSPGVGGRVFGTTEVFERSFTLENRHQPIDLDVRLAGNGRTVSTRSSQGRYEFAGLQPGRYEVSILAPDGYFGFGTTRPAEIPNNRACVEEIFGLTRKGRVAGRIVDADGRGVSKVLVELTAEGADLDGTKFVPTVSAISDADGYFELIHLPPGRFIVGLNLRDLPNRNQPYARTVFPGGTEPSMPIVLALGQAADLGRWAIPQPLAPVTLAGRIVWKDGTPAGGAQVRISDVGRNTSRPRHAGSATATSDGHFMLDAREGRTYEFTAVVGNRPVPIAALRVEARAGLAPVQIIIQLDPPR